MFCSFFSDSLVLWLPPFLPVGVAQVLDPYVFFQVATTGKFHVAKLAAVFPNVEMLCFVMSSQVHIIGKLLVASVTLEIFSLLQGFDVNRFYMSVQLLRIGPLGWTMGT